MRRQMGWVVGRPGRRISGRYGHPVYRGVNVDAGSVWMRQAQRLRRSGLAQILLDAWRHNGLLGKHQYSQCNPRPRAREAVVVKQFPKRGHARARHQ